MKRSGVRLAITTSAPATIAQLPASLSIDELNRPIFIASMESGPEQLAVVRSIVKLGETLHLRRSPRGSRI
jgi:hypothetical protein